MERKRDKGPSPVWMVFFIVFLLVIVTALLSGCNIINPKTGSLQGTVHRETLTSSAPLEDALVTVSGSTGTAETDGNGHFFLNEVPAGKRTVTIIREGYIKLQLLNVYIEPETVNEANFGNPIVLQPKEDRAIFDNAMEYYEAGNYELALNSFQDLLNDFPDTIWADDAQYYIAWCNLAMEEYTQAITEFENLLLNYPDSEYRDDSQYYIGWTYETKLGLPIPAILAYYTFLFEYPDSQWADDAQLGAGNCYYGTSDYGNAITEYQKVIDNYPFSDLLPLAQYSIAQSYRLAYYRNTAIEKYEELILLYPNSEYCSPSQYYIGYCYYEKGQYNMAIDEFQKTINNYPNSTWPEEDRQVVPVAQFYTGWCFEKLESWEEAIAAYQLVIDYYPGSTFSNGDSIPAYCQERIDWINENYFPETPEEEI
jgi:TolA-binding protein